MRDDREGLLARLRRETRPLHDDVERVAAVGGEGTTAARYLWFLRRLGGFVPALEQALARGPLADDPALALDARRKAALLAEDLRTLDDERKRDLRPPTAADAPPCPALPDVSTSGRAWGALYVLEGSTLGGQQLRRDLAARLPQLAGAFRYVDAYGAETGAMWSRFRAALAARADGAAFDDEVVAGARDTFAALAGWLRADAPAEASP